MKGDPEFEQPSGFPVWPARGRGCPAGYDPFAESRRYIVPPIASIGNCGHGRLRILGSAKGAWSYRTIFNGVEACPRDINITRATGEVNKELKFRKF
jgi:succinate dehydrogenase/fumarate reductase-like Fe-S protein